MTKRIRESNFTVSPIHGEMSQKEREGVMNEFRNSSIDNYRYIGTGIDVKQISLVINYDLPNSRENYIHRIGRSERFGRKGLAIN